MEQKETIAALSQAFADYIVTCYEPVAIQSLIERRYGYLLSYEQQAIQTILQKKPAPFHEQIVEKVQTSLCQEDIQFIEGIVQFRLKEYVAHLSQRVDWAVHTYELQQEQEAFLLLLRRFVEEQLPLYNTIHFIVRENELVDLLDEEGHVIVYACHGDVLMDTLLTIAPRKIVMHHIENFLQEALLITIQSVFGGKISICNGCALCGKIQL